MNKKITITLSIFFLLILIIVAFYFYLNYSPTKKSFLHIINNEVEVYDGKVWKQAFEGMELDERDNVKTNENGRAAIILFESIIIDLDQNTETLLKEISKEKIKLEQTKG